MRKARRGPGILSNCEDMYVRACTYKHGGGRRGTAGSICEFTLAFV
jgi:hypothetical protein